MEDLSALLNKFFESWTFIILSGLGFTDMAVRASSNGEIRVIHTVLPGSLDRRYEASSSPAFPECK
jgi:hypothetical protein